MLDQTLLFISRKVKIYFKCEDGSRFLKYHFSDCGGIGINRACQAAIQMAEKSHPFTIHQTLSMDLLWC